MASRGYSVHLYSDKARCFNQSARALYRNFIITSSKIHMVTILTRLRNSRKIICCRILNKRSCSATSICSITDSHFHLKLAIVIFIVSEPCDVLDNMKTTFPTCYYAYSKGNEDMTPFNKPGWVPVENTTKKDELNQLCPKPWRYQGPAETDTVPKWGRFSLYPGGGFVADLGYENNTGQGVIQSLQRNGWLDLQSRTVILEFSAFNPTTNLLVVATYFYEIGPSGFKASFERTQTVPVYSKENVLHQFYLVSMLLFIIFVLLYVGRICYTVCKQGLRFFKSFWNWVEILQVVFSVLGVVMNFVRSSKAVSIIRQMRANIYANVNFQEVIALIEAENGVLGIAVFLITLKLLRVIRYNKHVALFSRTLKASANVLLSLMAVFLIGFVAFMQVGMLVFETVSLRYSSLLQATYFQLELVLGKVKKRSIDELSDASRTFGKIFAAGILLSLTILLTNFFISAINDALTKAKHSVFPNTLYELVDKPGLVKDKEKKIFYNVSKHHKQTTTKKNEVAELHSKDEADTPLEKCDRDANISTSRQKRKQEASLKKPDSTRRKSFNDRNSNTVSQLKRRLSPKDVTELQLSVLRKKEEYMFQRLHSIIHADYYEDEAFYLLCHQTYLEKAIATR